VQDWRQNSPRAASLNAEEPEKLRELPSGIHDEYETGKLRVKNSVAATSSVATLSLLMNVNF